MKIKYQFTALVVIALGFFSGSSLLTEFLSDRGFQKFQKGIAFTGYSRQAYASPAAVYPSGIVEVPVAGGALAVVYNLPGNTSLVRTPSHC